MTLAFDKKSLRHYDANGNLHVALCNISKETVNPYRGDEIPGWEELGLDPDRVYQMYRPGDELAKAAKTFNNMTLFFEHPDDAVTPENPVKEQACGSLGTDAQFVSPYLQNSIVVTDAEAIKGVEDGTCDQISSSYSYEPDMSSGVFNDLRYDGKMVNIAANHVALVPEGRAGPDVIVSDALPKGLKMRKKLKTVLKSKLARDADIDLAEIKQLLDSADKDGMVDDEDMNEDPMPMDEGPAMEYLKGILNDEQMAEYSNLCKPKADDADMDDDNDADMDDEPKPPVKAMDANSIRASALAEFNAIRTAERAVEPIIGTLKVTMDSAAAVYRLALDARKVPHKEIKDVNALAAMVKMLPVDLEPSTPLFANDSAGAVSPLDAIAAKALPLKRS